MTQRQPGRRNTSRANSCNAELKSTGVTRASVGVPKNETQLDCVAEVAVTQQEQIRVVRNAAATAFIGLLIAIAFQEMVAPVKASLDRSGITFNDIALSTAFFVLATATFLFGQYNLLFVAYQGFEWLANFLFYTLECLLFIFLGGETTVSASKLGRFGFFDYLLVYFVLETVWNLLTLVRNALKHDSAAIEAQFPYVVVTVVALAEIVGILAKTGLNTYSSGSIGAVVATVLVSQALIFILAACQDLF